MQQEVRITNILRAVAGADMPEAHIKEGGRFYMVRDAEIGAFRVVKWDRVRWLCSCGKGPCEHKRYVNDFLTEEFVKSRATGDDLAAHVEDASGK